MSKITFTHTQSPFFRTLKQKVDNYFSTNNIHTSGNTTLFFKGLLQVCSAIILYTILVFFTPSIFISILLCILFGINLAMIGFNIMHEGVHQSFSKYKWLNTTTGYFLNVLGANSFFWKIKHNVNHHTFTNIDGMDSDIDVQPLMRLHEHQPRYWFHKFQHLYWIILYGISYITWVFYFDFVKYFSGAIAPGVPQKKLNSRESIIFWTTKLLYVAVYIILPIFFVGWLPALIGFCIVSFVTGLFIAVVFQLAHVVEDTQFPLPNTHSKIEQEWAVHQLNTTANFHTKNKIISWILGGLNFQVEHHLFPRISHIHYPKISLLVKETCKEYNIAYLEYPTAFKAFWSHIVHIKRLGRA